MAKFNVHLNGAEVIISKDGYETYPVEGREPIGSFDMDVDPATNQYVSVDALNELKQAERPNGDHPFVVQARKVLQEHLGDDVATNGYTFVDKASNAPMAPPENNFHTNAIPVTDGSGDADHSAQAGGEDAVIPPAARAALAGSEELDQAKDTLGDTTDNATDVNPNAQNTPKVVTENDGTNAGEAKAATISETEKTETVADLKTRIAGVDNADELNKALADEKANANRAGAITAYENRIAELQK